VRHFLKKRIIASIIALSVTAVGWLFGFEDKPVNSSKVFSEEKLPAKIESIQKEGMSPKHYINAYVVKVTDGDTFEITYKDQQERVRLLCVDTPETVAKGVEVQTYGKEASDFTKEKLLNQSVKLYFDKGLRDKYGRLLAYTVLQDDVFFNAVLIKYGYARVEIVYPNSSLKDYFFSLQEKALEEKIGFWGLPQGKQPFVLDKNGKYIARYRQ